MTRDDILNMPAGREMDALVWMRVWNGGTATGELPHYSTDIFAAFSVMEKMGIALIPQSSEFGFRWYACDIEKVVYGESVDVFEKNESGVSEETAPLAICRTALLARMKPCL